jgi:hypothetical protein
MVRVPILFARLAQAWLPGYVLLAMPKKALAALLCASVLPFAAVTADAAKKKPKGVATAVGYQRGLPFYHGQLKSKRAACLKNRTVTYYGKSPGQKDKVRSRGTSDAQGKWYVPLPNEDTSADTAIYFKVSQAKRQGVTCKSGRTKDIPIGGN